MTQLIDRNICASKKIDQGKMLKAYFINGLPEPDIANMFGVSKQAVNQALKPFKQLINNPEKLRAYRDNRALIFDGIESELVSLALDRDKHKKATLGNVAYALDKVYNINRLEQNKSTQNLNVSSMIQHLDAESNKLIEQIRELEADAPQPVATEGKT